MIQRKRATQDARAGEVLTKMAEKKQLPDFWFLQRGGIGAWRAKRRLPEKEFQKAAIRRSKGGGL
jgi:hypothetical protein